MDVVDIAAFVFVGLMVVAMWVAVGVFISQDAKHPNWYKRKATTNADDKRTQNGDAPDA